MSFLSRAWTTNSMRYSLILPRAAGEDKNQLRRREIT